MVPSDLCGAVDLCIGRRPLWSHALSPEHISTPVDQVVEEVRACVALDSVELAHRSSTPDEHQA